MNMIPAVPDDNGAYYFHESSLMDIPEGMLLWPDGLDTDAFFAHNGMILPEVTDVDGVPTVASYETNAEAWEAFCAQFPDGVLPPMRPIPQPTAEQILDVLLGEVSGDE